MHSAADSHVPVTLSIVSTVFGVNFRRLDEPLVVIWPVLTETCHVRHPPSPRTNALSFALANGRRGLHQSLWWTGYSTPLQNAGLANWRIWRSRGYGATYGLCVLEGFPLTPPSSSHR